MTRYALALAGVLVGAIGLTVEYVVLAGAAAEAGAPIWFAPVFFSSFFTNLVNALVVLVLVADLVPSERLSRLRHPGLLGFCAVSISLVGSVYYVWLSSSFVLEGALLWAILAIHYVTPVIYLVWWGLYGATGQLRMTRIARWVVLVLIYFGYAMAFNLLSGQPIYPFLDTTINGPANVVFTVLTIAALFLGLCFAVWGFDRFVVRRRLAAIARNKPR